MQRIEKLKDEALKRAPGGGADKKPASIWSKITSAVSDAVASATGRKQADQKRKKVAAAGAAGAATAAGAAGVLLSKKKSRDSEAEREAAYQAPQPPTEDIGTNGAAAPPVSSSEPSA